MTNAPAGRMAATHVGKMAATRAGRMAATHAGKMAATVRLRACMVGEVKVLFRHALSGL